MAPETTESTLEMTIVAISEKPVRTTSTPETPRWQEEMRAAIRCPIELCKRLGLPIETASQAASGSFPVFVPPALLSRIERGNLADPILRQVLPVDAECDRVSGFAKDPLQEKEATVTTGMIQKYKHRVLLIAIGVCAVHCRYCFRREFPYSEAPHALSQWQPALDQIRADESIHEVILSGGDPLTLVDRQLRDLVSAIGAIEHVQRIRLHTRLPIVIPQRVTSELVDMLRTETGHESGSAGDSPSQTSPSRLSTSPTPVVVVHTNHVAEIDGAVERSLATLIDAGIPVLNQTVLLAGVNDSVDALCNLFERLANLRVMPYYLHQLDRVSGTAHFEVPVSRGIELIHQVRARLSGYAVPRYVQEQPGVPNKVVLA